MKDEAAWFTRHYNELFLTAEIHLQQLKLYRIVGADDIVQEVWLRVAPISTEIQKKPVREQTGLMFEMLRNVLIDQWRRYTRQKRDIRKEIELQARLAHSSGSFQNWLIVSQTSPGSAVANADEKSRLVDTVRNLPDNIRELLLCRFVLEMSLQEIADSMQLRSTAEVSKQIKIAVDELRRRMPNES